MSARGTDSRKARRKKKEDPRGKVPPPVSRTKRKPEEINAPSKRKADIHPGVELSKTHGKKPVEPKIESEDGEFRSGYVALIGRPNVGKSTLLNQLLGQKIAATTHKPQTTRKNILGMLHPEGAQILLLDTPGHHKGRGPLNRFMVSQANTAIRDADVVAYVVEARSDGKITEGNERILGILKKSSKPIVVLINKIDEIENKNSLLLMMRTLSDALEGAAAAIVPISALQRDGLEEAVIALGRALPPGPKYFEDGQITDQPERAIVAELVREKIILETTEELPYAAAVVVTEFEDLRPRIVRVAAEIHVERDSQKGIVIGKKGARLKAIGERARKDAEFLLGSKVYLDLHVVVSPRWSSSEANLARLGYVADGGDTTGEE